MEQCNNMVVAEIYISVHIDNLKLLVHWLIHVNVHVLTLRAAVQGGWLALRSQTYACRD